MFKRFMRSRVIQITAGWLVAAWITFVKYTTRWDVSGADRARSLSSIAAKDLSR